MSKSPVIHDYVQLGGYLFRRAPITYRVYAALIDYAILPGLPWLLMMVVHLVQPQELKFYLWMVPMGLVLSWANRGVGSVEPSGTLGQRLFGIRMVPESYPASRWQEFGVQLLREPVKWGELYTVVVAVIHLGSGDLPMGLFFLTLALLVWLVVPLLTGRFVHDLVTGTQYIVERPPHPRAYRLLARYVLVWIILLFFTFAALSLRGLPDSPDYRHLPPAPGGSPSDYYVPYERLRGYELPQPSLPSWLGRQYQ